ncbi:MAG: Hint domain-containing protein [Acidocella sp.]|nr:Hint domain-containing protein [Acidocella sp.]
MTGTTITSTKTLTTTNDAPPNYYTLASGNTITVSNTIGVVGTGTSSFAPNIINNGLITANGTVTGIGIEMLASPTYSGTAATGAYVLNSGTITAGKYGIEISNQNVSSGTTTSSSAATAFIENSGTIIAGSTAASATTNVPIDGITVRYGVQATIINNGTIKNLNPGNALGGDVTLSSDINNSETFTNGLNGVLLNTPGQSSFAMSRHGNGSTTVVGTINIVNDGYIQHAVIEYDGVSTATSTGNLTITNAGTIGGIGTNQFGQAGTEAIYANDKGTLILDPGQSLGGGFATFGSGSTLELSQITAGSTGTLSNPGSYLGFSSLSVTSGANWDVTGSVKSIGTVVNDGTVTLGGTQGTLSLNAGGLNANSVTDLAGSDAHVAITNFGAGDTLVVGGTNISFATGDTITETLANGTLTVVDTTKHSTFATKLSTASGGLTSYSKTTTAGANGVIVTIPCYAAGTHILTSEGEMKVEDLAVGMSVITVREGGPAMREIVWTGKRSIDISRHPDPAIIRPVCIRAGAFEDGLPERDLRVSPHHAVYVNGCLFEAVSLVNGVSIIQETATTHVTYHHIELDAHDVMLAEGLPAESYLNTGSRNMFESVSDVMVLHADFRPAADADFCAPMIREGAALTALRAELQARANRLDQRKAA